MDRRDFLARTARTLAGARAAWLVSPPALVGLSRKAPPPIAGGFADDGAARGHRVRDGEPLPPAGARERVRTDVAIVGGGVGGLSAAWRLDALGARDWVLLELEGATGGNARGGGNEVSRYPWGAHYLPLPDADAVHVSALLAELGVMDGAGRVDERLLVHEPDERIFQHGRWHAGLAPLDAAGASVRAEFARFEAQVAEWRATGAFRVPLANGDRAGDAARATHGLDGVTAADWLATNGYRSPQLRWWVEYGTRDDYGVPLSAASMWAAAHYFAARDPDAEGPITWPEGNAWLTERLSARLASREAAHGARVRCDQPVRRLEQRGARWIVHTPSLVVECDAVIWAAPAFVLPRVTDVVVPPVVPPYAPWVVANVTLRRRPEERPGSAPPSWDNVVYDSPSLGWVDATHQQLVRVPGEAAVYTWYRALVDDVPAESRRALLTRPWTSWRDEIVRDLSRAHPGIEADIARIDVMRWAHAMARPEPGLLARREAWAAWRAPDGFAVAHADVGGVSLFEEAQWCGVRAAERVAARDWSRRW